MSSNTAPESHAPTLIENANGTFTMIPYTRPPTAPPDPRVDHIGEAELCRLWHLDADEFKVLAGLVRLPAPIAQQSAEAPEASLLRKTVDETTAWLTQGRVQTLRFRGPKPRENVYSRSQILPLMATLRDLVNRR